MLESLLRRILVFYSTYISELSNDTYVTVRKATNIGSKVKQCSKQSQKDAKTMFKRSQNNAKTILKQKLMRCYNEGQTIPK